MPRKKKTDLEIIKEKMEGLSDDERKSLVRDTSEMIVTDSGYAVEGRNIIWTLFGKTPYSYIKGQEEVRKIARELYLSNAMVSWFVDTTVSFVVGRGFVLPHKAESPIAAVINRFNEINEVQYMLRKMYRGDMIEGEGFYRLFIARKDGDYGGKKGDVFLRRVDTDLVKIDFNPADPQDVNYYMVSWYDQVAHQQVVEKIPPLEKFLYSEGVTDDEVSFTPAKQKKVVIRGNSCMIHFKMNDLPNQVNGVSDVRKLIEWVELYAELLRSGTIVFKLRAAGAYDITIDCDDPDTFEKEAAKYTTWTIGNNFIHNSKVKTETREFTSSMDSFEELKAALFLMIITGTRMGENYAGSTGSGSRATAQTIELPTMKNFEERQDDWIWMWRKIYKAVILVSEKFAAPALETPGIKIGKVGGLIEEYEKNFKDLIQLPEVSTKERLRLIENLQKEKDLGTVSLQTASDELGRDYKVEQDNKKKHQDEYGMIPEDDKSQSPDDDPKSEAFSKKDEPPEGPEDGGNPDSLERRLSKQG